jgi:hypothetical protein
MKESSKVLPDSGIHGLRRERFRQLGEIPRITSWAIRHQPGKHHDPQDLRTRFICLNIALTTTALAAPYEMRAATRMFAGILRRASILPERLHALFPHFTV